MRPWTWHCASCEGSLIDLTASMLRLTAVRARHRPYKYTAQRTLFGTHKGHHCQEGVRTWPGDYARRRAGLTVLLDPSLQLPGPAAARPGVELAMAEHRVRNIPAQGLVESPVRLAVHGSGGGPEKPTSGNTGRALRADLTCCRMEVKDRPTLGGCGALLASGKLVVELPELRVIFRVELPGGCAGCWWRICAGRWRGAW